MYTCMVSDDGGNNYGEVSVQLIVLGACHVPGAPILRQCWGAGGGVAVLLGKAQPLTRGNAEGEHGARAQGRRREWWAWAGLRPPGPALVIAPRPPVPPSKPTVSVPSSATIGTRAVLTCSESDGSPPSEYYWLKDGTQMPTEPKSSRAFSNSSYTLNHKTGELVGRAGGRGRAQELARGSGDRQFRQEADPCCALQIFDPVSASDTGEYTCQAQNGYGTPVRSDPVRMQAGEQAGGRGGGGAGAGAPC